MAEIFNFYVQDNRTIQFPKNNLLEPIMQEDHNVAIWRFRIPKVLNDIDMSGYAWWFVYVNARGQEFSELLTLVDDIDEPDSFCTADYSIDYGISYHPGNFQFSLEAINADSGGEILNEWHTKTYAHKVDKTLQGNQAQWSETESDIISALIVEVQNKVAQLVGGATPEPKNLVADMTDPQKVYLYVGSEEDESNGYWYYHNGTRFVPGGLYASGIIVDPVPTQGSNNAVSSGGVYTELTGLKEELSAVEETVDCLYNTAVASGSIATTVDALPSNAVELIAEIKLVQSGTGDPSPDNVRAISGWTGMTVSQSGEDTSDPDETAISWETAAGTVYGGTLNLTTGLLTVTHTKLAVSTSNTTVKTGSTASYPYGRYMRTVLTGAKIGSTGYVWDKYVKSNALKKVTTSEFKASATGFYAVGQGQVSIYWQTPACATDDGATALRSADIYFVYPLATPLTYQLTATEIALIRGINKIWVDTGNVSLKYKQDKAHATLQNISADFDGTDDYHAGEYSIHDGKLYKFTAPHAGSWDGDDVEETDVGSELYELKNKALPEKGYGLSEDASYVLSQIPSYYTAITSEPSTYDEAYSYLERKINSIPVGRSFFFITDTHWTGNEKHSTQLINYIRKRTGIRKVLFGGDIKGNSPTGYQFVRDGGEYVMQSRQAFGYDYLPAVGDHDNNTNLISGNTIENQFVPYAQVARLFMGDLKGVYHPYQPAEKLANFEYCTTEAQYNECMAFFRTVYYVDDDYAKIRYITLNNGTGACSYGAMYEVFGSSESSVLRLQIDWLVETLMSTPAGYDVVVNAHKVDTASTSGNTIEGILTNFAKAGTYSPRPSSVDEKTEAWWSHNGNDYDFSNRPDIGWVISVGGHTHADDLRWGGYENGEYSRANAYDGEKILNQHTKGQIPYITTQTDAAENTGQDDYTMTPGTVTEQCFDVVTFVDDGLVITRFGAGVDRRVYITS